MLVNWNTRIIDNIYTDWLSLGSCPATVSTCPSTSNVVSKSAEEVLVVFGFFDVPLLGAARCCPVSPCSTYQPQHSITRLMPCHSQWIRRRRRIVSVQLHLVLPAPSSSSCIFRSLFQVFLSLPVLSGLAVSDSMIQPQMDRDRFRNISNFDLVEPNRIGTRYTPALDCYLLTFWHWKYCIHAFTIRDVRYSPYASSNVNYFLFCGWCKVWFIWNKQKQ